LGQVREISSLRNGVGAPSTSGDMRGVNFVCESEQRDYGDIPIIPSEQACHVIVRALAAESGNAELGVMAIIKLQCRCIDLA